MKLKQYTKIKLGITLIIAVIFSQSIIYKNYWIPVATLVLASLVLIYLRRKVDEVIADERDYLIAGKASFLAIQIYAWCATTGMFVLYALRDNNPAYEPIAITLAYSTCFLMIIYTLLFRFHNKITILENKNKYIGLVIFLSIVLIVFGIRLFSGEDNWICKNGQWIKHGNPSFAAPAKECK